MPTQNGVGTGSAKRWQTGFRVDLKYISWKDVKTFIALIKSKLKGNEPMDDHTMLMERVIQLVAGLPTKSRNRVLLTDQFIDELWDSLDHPVLSYIGEKYMYRRADGSNNNPLFPQMGAAGTTYARSVRPTIMPPGALPDPALIFDTVMKRSSEGYRKHPNNVSSILWYWATIIIHDLFWTDPKDMTKTNTSSYLDLSPLYGSNQDMQNTIRTFQDGKLKPDSYADKRLGGMPPGVSVLLVMFNRFHNHVAEHLAAINEGGRFTPPPGQRPGLFSPFPIGGPDNEKQRESDEAWKKYDEDLFQTARLVTSGLYINITLVDYVRNIVNLNRCDTTWTLDPRQEMGRDAGTAAGAASGTGNVVSAEFNLCYRWHSCISEKDDKWIQELFANLIGKSSTEVTLQDMIMGFANFDRKTPDDPAQRTFGDFQRDPKTGKYSDDDLVECITSSIEDCAGAFGARNVPLSMRPVEILGILQGRKWHVAGLNEFRRHFGLKPYDTFEELNSDPEVASCLRHLYEHPDFVELYPGLVAEEAKEPMVPGVGIAPTYTISRVVLSDAVCLVRGDRYYTTDYSARALTNWGYNEVQYDLSVNHGCCFSKLFLRAFPNHFKTNSVYAHYPMVIPPENHRILTSLNRAELFTWERPAFSPPPVVGARHTEAQYRDMWCETTNALTGNSGATLSPNEAYVSGEGWEDAVTTSYAQLMDELLREKSYELVTTHFVDIIRDVGNLAGVHFVSRLFSLPVKTSSNPKGIYTADELHAVLTLIYLTTYLDSDAVKAFPLRQAAKTVAVQLGELTETAVSNITGWFGTGKTHDSWAAYGTDFIKNLSKSGLSSSDIAWSQILPASATTVSAQGAMFAQAVDFYLFPENKSHLLQIQQLAREDPSDETDARLLGYALEAVRLSATPGGGKGRDSGDAGSHVLVEVVAGKINPDRPIESYILPGPENDTCLGKAVIYLALTEMFRAVFRLDNLRRAPGPQGELKKISTSSEPFGMYLTEDWCSVSPLPWSMKVCWG
ncbi:heme peroxidase [Cryphonectria parasitica EP155]|uniref:Heme peroxidase n=1 Tax=Cryphonectria parasitica (strain ATCC 38755 / EP155) TaxID=660469 RepID=A0A9P4XXZ7_CRYP1|nr:heme peroxidase [Cryphonectria parasitica EP155]KAF3763417.1 heme peroxidase [Cryphonectria parasitica EP155]